MLQVKRVVRFDDLVGGIIEDAVVEDFTVLINLDKGGAFVSRGPFESLG